MNKLSNKNILIQFINEAWNKGNLDVVDEFCSPEYQIHNDPGDAFEFKTMNLTEFKNRVRYSRHVFSHLHFDIKDFVCDNDKVTISWFMSGTHQNDLPPLVATGKKINVSGLTIYYFQNAKITGHWQVFDRLGLLLQLGVQIKGFNS